MKTLSVEEAQGDLANLVRRASLGEQIAIRQNGATVFLQGTVQVRENEAEKLTPLEALNQLQARSNMTREQATAFLNEVRADRQDSR